MSTAMVTELSARTFNGSLVVSTVYSDDEQPTTAERLCYRTIRETALVEPVGLDKACLFLALAML